MLEFSLGVFTTQDNNNDVPDLSIGTVNLKNSKVSADVLLGDGLIIEPKNCENQYTKAIPNGAFTLNADHSVLEGRAKIAKDRNVHFDLQNQTRSTKSNKMDRKNKRNRTQ